jgi:hypothetical protein
MFCLNVDTLPYLEKILVGRAITRAHTLSRRKGRMREISPVRCANGSLQHVLVMSYLRFLNNITSSFSENYSKRTESQKKRNCAGDISTELFCSHKLLLCRCHQKAMTTHMYLLFFSLYNFHDNQVRNSKYK